jgi:hypothetical protein
MKLYKLNTMNQIIGSEVQRETPTTYKYRWPNATCDWTVKKKNVDVVKGSIHRITATSPKLLIDLIVQSLDSEIKTYKRRIDYLQRQKENIQNIKIK